MEQLNGRTNIALLEAVADTGIGLLVMGPRERTREPQRFAANRASFPLKSLEYLAAGRPVVSTDLPASRRVQQETPDVRIEPKPVDFAAEVLNTAARAAADADVVARRSVTRRSSWSTRAAQPAELIEHAGLARGVGSAETSML